MFDICSYYQLCAHKIIVGISFFFFPLLSGLGRMFVCCFMCCVDGLVHTPLFLLLFFIFLLSFYVCVFLRMNNFFTIPWSTICYRLTGRRSGWIAEGISIRFMEMRTVKERNKLKKEKKNTVGRGHIAQNTHMKYAVRCRKRSCMGDSTLPKCVVCRTDVDHFAWALLFS